jgi:hypothetical protein
MSDFINPQAETADSTRYIHKSTVPSSGEVTQSQLSCKSPIIEYR